MKQRPILFKSSMVRAILSGKKTQTRRIVKPHRSDDAFCLQDFNDGNGWWPYRSYDGESPFMDGNEYPIPCPFGAVGDQLWVRETWQYYDWTEDGMPCIRYATGNQTMWAENADESAEDQWEILSRPANYNIDNRASDRKWRPSIHMPRWASRITLEITSIRVERLNDISEDDALSEGAIPINCDHVRQTCNEIGCYGDTAKAAFRGIWESTGGNWEANPWVWVIEFKRVEQ